jgi:gamma-glutamyl:cysteine ligase YbdK (ATP-grasp superfamily)
MPTGGTPPLLPDWPAWEVSTGADDTRRHWDAWPRPEHGTLEVRVMDQQTDVRRSAGFAALIQGLVAAVADEEPAPYDRELYAKRRAEAARLPPDSEEVATLAELVGPRPYAKHVLAGRPEAERQLELGPEAALRELASRS